MTARVLVAVVAPGREALPEGLLRWSLGDVDVVTSEVLREPSALAALAVALGRHHAEREPVVPLRWGTLAADPSRARELLGATGPWRAKLEIAARGVEWGLTVRPVGAPAAPVATGPGAQFLARSRERHAAALQGERTRDAVIARVGGLAQVGDPAVDAGGPVRLPLLVAAGDLPRVRDALTGLEGSLSGPWAPASFVAWGSHPTRSPAGS